MTTEPIIVFQGELMFLGWKDSNSTGPEVRFLLADSEDLERFKKMTARKKGIAGQRLAVVMVEINDDEEPVRQTEPQPEGATQEGGVTPERKEKNPAPLARSAAIQCTYPPFQHYVKLRIAMEPGAMHFFGTPPTELARIFMLRECGISSRAELDTNPEAAARYKRMMAEYREWTEKNQTLVSEILRGVAL